MNARFFIKATISLLLLSLLLVQIVNATTETRYFRSDTANVNGLTTEILGTSQSGVAGTRSQGFSNAEDNILYIYLGSRVWKRNEGGSETEITSGSPIAQVSRNMVGSGIQSNSWACPETALDATDSIIVRTYARVMFSGRPPSYSNWILLDTWQTEQLDAIQLDAVTWTFYYHTQLTIVPFISWTMYFRFDTATYNSRITNFQYTPVPTAEWHDIAEWNFNLTTKQWLDVSQWSFNLSTMQWNKVSQWTFSLITRGWHEVQAWTFSLSHVTIQVLFIGLVALFLFVAGLIYFAMRKKSEST